MSETKIELDFVFIMLVSILSLDIFLIINFYNHVYTLGSNFTTFLLIFLNVFMLIAWTLPVCDGDSDD